MTTGSSVEPIHDANLLWLSLAIGDIQSEFVNHDIQDRDTCHQLSQSQLIESIVVGEVQYCHVYGSIVFYV